MPWSTRGANRITRRCTEAPARPTPLPASLSRTPTRARAGHLSPNTAISPVELISPGLVPRERGPAGPGAISPHMSAATAGRRRSLGGITEPLDDLTGSFWWPALPRHHYCHMREAPRERHIRTEYSDHNLCTGIWLVSPVPARLGTLRDKAPGPPSVGVGTFTSWWASQLPACAPDRISSAGH
jgi:hypothetical protein